jgi:hypothetical protein
MHDFASLQRYCAENLLQVRLGGLGMLPTTSSLLDCTENTTMEFVQK